LKSEEVQLATHTHYDLFTAQFKANPFPTFAAMRESDPIYAHTAPDGSTIWYVTRYNDVVDILRDDRRFVKDPQNAGRLQSPSRQRNPTLYQSINDNMLFSDAPDHTRLRALVSQAFTPRRVAAMAGRIQLIADELLDPWHRQGEVDLIADYALPLPLIVITEMLGIPAAERDDVCDWSQAIISPGSRGHNYSTRKRKLQAFVAYLRRLFAERQANPEDDLVTALVQAEEAGERLTEAELCSMVALLLVTGYETTVNLIGNSALALLQHSVQRKLLMDNWASWPVAIEELLRYDGPVETSTSRWAAEDIELRDHKIAKGDLVRVVLASANRDAAHFDRPDALDVTRADNRHLAFGLGIHYCLGAPLARLEGRIALETLFGRYPKLRLVLPPDQLSWRSGVLFRGLRHFPIILR
jgi:cytochrome P450